MIPEEDREAVRHDRSFKVAAVAFLAVLYLLFLARFSVTLNGERYFVLHDDQMISMRYAENLAVGNGLVWNPGERVEGFTNPLWTAYMAVWHLGEIPRSKTSLAIMLTSAVILILNALTIYSIASRLSPASPSVARVAMILAGTYWPLVDWSLEGFEVGLTALLISIVALEAFIYMTSKQPRHLGIIAICLVALGWTRLELLAVAGIPVAYLLLNGTNRARIVTRVIIPVALSVALIFAGRHWYYGEWLPNTYYLKLTGVPLGDRLYLGFSQASSTVLTHFSVVLAPIALGGRIKARLQILIAIFAAALLYTVYIGGDTWERPFFANRFLSATTPLLMVAALYLTRARVQHEGRTAPIVVAAVGFLIAVGLSGRSFHRWLQDDVKHWKLFQMTALGLQFRENAPPDSRVAVVWAGALPYFSSLYSIDLLGKSDKVIARSTPHSIWPGHNKWNYAYSIGVLKPDYIIELQEPSVHDIEFVARLGYTRRATGFYSLQPVATWQWY